MAAASSTSPLLLGGPATPVDALPYIDKEFNDPDMQVRVRALIQEEMRSFKPETDYLAKWPMYEPSFDANPLLQAEWIRVCSEAPMSKIDTSRYQLEAPPPGLAKDPDAWRRAIDNAQAQLENQGTRLGNLELLQQHGAKLWLASLNQTEAASRALAREEADLTARIDSINRKRKADQLQAAPQLARLEENWIGGIKKNLEIEAQCLRLEAECAHLREEVDATQRR